MVKGSKVSRPRPQGAGGAFPCPARTSNQIPGYGGMHRPETTSARQPSPRIITRRARGVRRPSARREPPFERGSGDKHPARTSTQPATERTAAALGGAKQAGREPLTACTRPARGERRRDRFLYQRDGMHPGREPYGPPCTQGGSLTAPRDPSLPCSSLRGIPGCFASCRLA